LWGFNLALSHSFFTVIHWISASEHAM
jgi:hypothetical protein